VTTGAPGDDTGGTFWMTSSGFALWPVLLRTTSFTGSIASPMPWV